MSGFEITFQWLHITFSVNLKGNVSSTTMHRHNIYIYIYMEKEPSASVNFESEVMWESFERLSY